MKKWIGGLKKGGLHESLGVPIDSPIPGKMMQGALMGKFGPKALKQANAAKTLKKLRPK